MANVFTTLADLVKLNDQNARDLGVSDILNSAPVLKAIHATTASNGTVHNYIKETTAPTVGFRAVNTGRYVGASGYTEVSITLKNLDASTLVDKAIADNYRGGADAFLQREAGNALQQAFFAMEQQMFYGTGSADASGFTGLGDNALFSAVTNNGNTVVDATGSTASTGSSCWLIRSTPDEKGLTAVLGKDGEISVSETVVTWKNDDTTPAKGFTAYHTPIMAYCGLQVGSLYSVVRIANLTAQTGKGLTDSLISSAMSLFPAALPPTHIVTNRRSLMQLQKSRTTYSPTGQPAPFPQDAFGIPIIVTDAIVNTETILT